MNKVKVLRIAMPILAMVIISACGPKAAPESDFTAKPIEGGTGVEITKYVGNKFEVVIPAKIQKLPVTNIGSYAFSYTGLTSITIPNSVTNIGFYAFYHTGLTSITIPSGVTDILLGVFSDCTSLTSITIPEGVTSIGEGAFENCISLTSITIPNSVTSIGPSIFRGCTSLTSITIPESVTSIGEGAFENCSITSVTFLGTIPAEGFYYEAFEGDLVEMYFAEGGGPGTYTMDEESWTWTKQ